jgi:hypothetical protein
MKGAFAYDICIVEHMQAQELCSELPKVKIHLIAELRSVNGTFSDVARASWRSVAGISIQLGRSFIQQIHER